jgi:hypothetical protein
LCTGVAKALFHDISLPSSSKGSRLSGIVPLPTGKDGIGLNLNRIYTENTAQSVMNSPNKNKINIMKRKADMALSVK